MYFFLGLYEPQKRNEDSIIDIFFFEWAHDNIIVNIVIQLCIRKFSRTVLSVKTKTSYG